MGIQLTTSKAAAFNHAGHRGAAIPSPYATSAEYGNEAKIFLGMELALSNVQAFE
jgi:hypothetical protein